LRYTPRRQIRAHIERQYRDAFGTALDLDDPRTFNEKLQWLKVYYRDRLLVTGSDKYAVRGHVREVVGEDYLIPLLGVHERAADVDFEALPSRFVLKTTNGSGTNILCTDRDRLDPDATRARLEAWLRPEASQYHLGYEWGYRDVPPRILCEEMIADPGTLRDYKFFCFNGEARFVYVATEYGDKSSIEMDFVDLAWRRLPYERTSYAPHPVVPDRPACFGEMLDVARRLAAPFPFVRVDLYETDGRVWFGELTFYPANGTGAFRDPAHDREIGDLLRLPPRTSLPRRLWAEWPGLRAGG